jgi:two-component system cell cycle response regulator DivK
MNPLSNRRIFVVEDDVTNMAVIVMLLRQNGAMVLQDPWNSKTVPLLMAHQPIDAILLDLMLRDGVSGYDIFKQIRQHEALAEIPVIAVSASDPAIEIPRAREMGFAGFIGKPIAMNRFGTQIAACLNGEAVWETGYAAI